MGSDCYFRSRVVRYGKRFLMRIPAAIVRQFRIRRGTVVRVSFIGHESWADSYVPRTIHSNLMERPGIYNPVLESDGKTWTAPVMFNTDYYAVRIPSEVCGWGLAHHDVVIVQFLGVVSEGPDPSESSRTIPRCSMVRMKFFRIFHGSGIAASSGTSSAGLSYIPPS